MLQAAWGQDATGWGKAWQLVQIQGHKESQLLSIDFVRIQSFNIFRFRGVLVGCLQASGSRTMPCSLVLHLPRKPLGSLLGLLPFTSDELQFTPFTCLSITTEAT